MACSLMIKFVYMLCNKPHAQMSQFTYFECVSKTCRPSVWFHALPVLPMIKDYCCISHTVWENLLETTLGWTFLCVLSGILWPIELWLVNHGNGFHENKWWKMRRSGRPYIISTLGVSERRGILLFANYLNTATQCSGCWLMILCAE
jgi:hypothetical protein